MASFNPRISKGYNPVTKEIIGGGGGGDTPTIHEIENLMKYNSSSNIINPNNNLYENVLNCFYDYETGKIDIDGHDTSAIAAFSSDFKYAGKMYYMICVDDLDNVENVKFRITTSSNNYTEIEVTNYDTAHILTGEVTIDDTIEINTISVLFDAIEPYGAMTIRVMLSENPITSFERYYNRLEKLYDRFEYLLAGYKQIVAMVYEGTTNASGNLTIQNTSDKIPLFATCTDDTSGLSAHLVKKDATSNIMIHVTGNDISTSVKTEIAVSGVLYCITGV